VLLVPAILAEIVLLRTVKLPAVRLIPPPPAAAELPVITTSCRVTVSLLAGTRKAPPSFGADPPVIVTPEMLTVSGRRIDMSKMPKLVAAAGSRRTVKRPDPGPVIVSGKSKVGRTDWREIVRDVPKNPE